MIHRFSRKSALKIPTLKFDWEGWLNVLWFDFLSTNYTLEASWCLFKSRYALFYKWNNWDISYFLFITYWFVFGCSRNLDLWLIYINSLQGIPTAPLWDFSKGQFVGVLSASDFILILKEVCLEAISPPAFYLPPNWCLNRWWCIFFLFLFWRFFCLWKFLSISIISLTGSIILIYLCLGIISMLIELLLFLIHLYPVVHFFSNMLI